MEFFQFDDEYVRRLQAGDRETEEHFSSHFGPRLVSKFRGNLPWSEIPDLVQDVFVAVVSALSRDKGPDDARKLPGWVNGIAGNLLSAWYRDHKHAAEPLDDNYDAPDDVIDVIERLVTKETLERVRRVLDALRPPRDAAVLRAIFIEERDKDEVCAEFGVERDYLRVILHRALNRFRADFTAPPPRPPRKTGEVKRFPKDRHYRAEQNDEP